MNIKFLFSQVLLLSFLSATPVFADTIVAQGVAGDMDSHSRCPVLTVSTENNPDNVKILADAYMQTSAYKKYPIRFDFYINRKLFATQIRSPELPGAVGVDIGPDVAVPPFNYTVIAEIVHPNRNFTTVIQGAVFNSETVKTYDCESTYVTSEGFEYVFTKDGVELTQTSDKTYSINMSATSSATENKLTLTGSISISQEDTASANLVASFEDSSDSYDLTGKATFNKNTLDSFELADSGNVLKLSCR